MENQTPEPQVPQPPVAPQMPVEQPAVMPPPPPPPQNPYSPSSMPPMGSMHRKKFFIILGIILALLFFVTSTVFVLAAYDVVPLGSSEFRVGLADFVQGLPLMPKTPLYVARKVSGGFADTNKFSFDLSVKVKNFEKLIPFTQINLGTETTDIHAKGKMDTTVPDKTQMDITVGIGSDFDVNYRSVNDKGYFRLNKLPVTLTQPLSLLAGYPEAMIQEVLGKWLSVPGNGSPAQPSERSGKRKKEQEEEWNSILGLKLMEAYRERTFNPQITMTSDTFEKVSMYKITVKMDKKAVEQYEKFASEADNEVYGSERSGTFLPVQNIPKQINFSLLVDKNKYFVHRFTGDLTLEVADTSEYGIISSIPQEPQVGMTSDSYPEYGGQVGIMPGKQTMIDIPIHIELTLRDIGKDIEIDVPLDAVPFDTFMQSLTLKYQDQLNPLLNPVGQLAKANNTKRRSDVNAILNAVSQYMADHTGVMPLEITDTPQSISKTGADLCSIIIPQYMAALPSDPSLNNGTPLVEENCTADYNTGYTIFYSLLDSSITVMAPYAELGESISVTR